MQLMEGSVVYEGEWPTESGGGWGLWDPAENRADVEEKGRKRDVSDHKDVDIASRWS